MKSFAELRVQKKVKINEKLIVKASYHTFSKFLIIQRSRQIDMRDMVQYELGPLPWALAKPNGKTRSSSKSALINKFDKEVPLVHLLPENTVKIFDAMVLIQQLPTSLGTIGDISDFILAKIMQQQARADLSEADLGLLQHPRWRTL